jgi:outer membrane protein assembly factor BamB
MRVDWRAMRPRLAMAGVLSCVLVLSACAAALLRSPQAPIALIGRLAPSLGAAQPRQLPTAPALPTATPGAAPSVAPPPLDPAQASDWTQYRDDVYGTGWNQLAPFRSANVGQLDLRWVATSDVGFLATPAIVGGIVYATTHQSLYAYDLTTGAVLWHYDGIPEGGAVNSSVAVDPTTRLAFYGTSTARLYAVDTATGQLAWTTLLGDPAAGAYIWGSPLLANGAVYIGLASQQDNPCVTGAIFALDIRTGLLRWAHTTAPAGALGGGVWSSLTADPSHSVVFATTGNPCGTTVVGPEEDSVLALDWNTGATQWSYQALIDDDCDCDFGEGALVYDYQGQEYLLAGNKAGMVYALTPPTAGTTATVAWSLAVSGAGFLGSGGVFEPPAYANGLVFVAGGPTPDGACPQGALQALTPDTGATVWRVCTASQVVSAAAISGDVIFVPMQDQLVGYDIQTGQVVWTAAQPGPAWGGVALSGGAIVSGSVGGDLYCYALPTIGPGAKR